MRSAAGVPRVVGAVGAILLLAACAPGSQAATSFRGGLAALEESRPEDAYADLERVRRVCGPAPLGQQAVLVEAAAALSGRAGRRDPQRAAVLTAAFLRQPRPPAWGVPVAESIFLMSRELGARIPAPEATESVFASEDGAGAESGEPGRPEADCGPRWELADGARPDVPGLDGTGMVAELERLRVRVDELEQELERLRGLLRAPDGGGP